MKKNIIYPVAPAALSAMTEMRQFKTVEQLEKWKDVQPFAVLFDNDFIIEYVRFRERLLSGNIEQPAIVKHMNPVSRKYHCDNCNKYTTAAISQYHLHFCSEECWESYNWEAGAQECDEERQRMGGDNFYTEKFYDD